MSKYNETIYVVQYESHNDGEWADVDGIMYTQYRNAVAKMGSELHNDPEYNHRIISLEKSVVVQVNATDNGRL